jgi:hypothetical protein
MKTPMQELLKEVSNAREIAMDINFRAALDFVRDAIEQDFFEKEKEQSISILTKYHNSLFSLPLKDGEAEAIYNHIVNTNKMV